MIWYKISLLRIELVGIVSIHLHCVSATSKIKWDKIQYCLSHKSDTIQPIKSEKTGVERKGLNSV